MSSFIPDDQLPPLSFGSRGFITRSGEVIGWSIVSADHNEYHRLNGTTDADFKTRWRKWTPRSPIEIDATVTPAERVKLEVWVERNANKVLPVPRYPHGPTSRRRRAQRLSGDDRTHTCARCGARHSTHVNAHGALYCRRCGSTTT